jgi:hypothetical protein
MRIPTIWLGLISAMFSVMPPANAQLELITIEKPFTAQSLSGTVVDPTGAPVPGAVVEECRAPFTPIEARDAQSKPNGEILHGDCTQGSIVTTAITNARGHFSLPMAKEGKTHYLHVASPGFDPMQITVNLKFFARAGVRIRLHIAT